YSACVAARLCASFPTRRSSDLQNSFERLLDECRRLSPTPVLVMPSAGWVSAYPVTLDPSRPSWPWPRNAPFALSELAESGQARRSEEHTSELQSRENLVCRLLL